jgi:hypothetical protein
MQTITSLPTAAALNGNEVLPADQNGATVKVTAAQLKTHAQSGMATAVQVTPRPMPARWPRTPPTPATRTRSPPRKWAWATSTTPPTRTSRCVVHALNFTGGGYFSNATLRNNRLPATAKDSTDGGWNHIKKIDGTDAATPDEEGDSNWWNL